MRASQGTRPGSTRRSAADDSFSSGFPQSRQPIRDAVRADADVGGDAAVHRAGAGAGGPDGPRRLDAALRTKEHRMRRCAPRTKIVVLTGAACLLVLPIARAATPT